MANRRENVEKRDEDADDTKYRRWRAEEHADSRQGFDDGEVKGGETEQVKMGQRANYF